MGRSGRDPKAKIGADTRVRGATGHGAESSTPRTGLEGSPLARAGELHSLGGLAG